MRILGSLLAFTVLLAAELVPARPAHAQDTEVRSILFYSPTCPHCHDVMDLHLPPMLERFGGRLRVITINASTPDGARLYRDMVTAYAVPRDRLGVPAMVVGAQVLVGSQEIPRLLPDIVEAGLAAGGIDWPAVPSIQHALARDGLLLPLPAPAAAPPPGPAQPPGAVPVPEGPAAVEVSSPETAPRGEAGTEAGLPAEAHAPASVRTTEGAVVNLTAAAGPSTVGERFLRDPVGNGVAVIVLAGLVLALAWAVVGARRRLVSAGRLPAWLIPGLVVVGAGIAAYMTFVEVTDATAICGPVGDCNTVQASPYAELLGVIPIGVLGLVGYATIAGLWLMGRSRSAPRRQISARLAWAAALLGTAFSAYLTFLEPFVIGATCAWCLTSAVVIAGILMAATADLRSLRTEPNRTTGQRAPIQ